MSRDRHLVVIATVAVVSVATRLFPLVFSSLPYNTDGFVFARAASRTLAEGALPVLESDLFLFVPLFSTVASVTGVDPLYLGAAVVAGFELAVALVAVVLVRDLSRSAGLGRTGTRVAIATTGLALAVNGLYLYRSATVSNEGLAHALVAVLALSLHRAFVREDRRWTLVALLTTVFLPFAHILGAAVAGLVLLGLVALHLARAPTRRRLAVGVVVVLGYWAGTAGYYLARPMGYTEDVFGAPGLFLAWAVGLVVLARWVDTTSDRVRRGAPLVLLGVPFVLLAASTLAAVHPGTRATAPLLVVLIVPLAVPVVLATRAGASLGGGDGAGVPVLALLLAPIALAGFALSAGLTPEYRSILTRAQTFAHLPVGVVLGVAVGRLATGERTRLVRGGVVVAVVACLLVSSVIPFTGLAVINHRPVTEESEFAAVTFAHEHAGGEWVSDRGLVQVGRDYYGASVSFTPAERWARGGPPPGCLTVARDSWTTLGVQLALGEPPTVATDRYRAWRRDGHRVYDPGGELVGVTRGESC